VSDIIKINPLKKTDLEFDVSIQGLDSDQPVIVRFVIVDVGGCDRSFPCSRVKDSKNTWLAKLPALPEVGKDNCQFRVEVIVDEYYFEPATGIIELFVQKPEVSTSFNVKQEKSDKPKVSTSFNVKQEEEEEKKETPPKKKEKLDEISGGPVTTWATIPTGGTNFSKPELPPLESSAKTSDHSRADDDNIDLDAIFDEDMDDADDLFDVTPGEGVSYPQDDGKQDRSARQIASDLIRGVMGSVQKPRQSQSQRSLFQRNEHGQITDNGFEPEEIRLQKKLNAAKVSKILNPD